MPYHTVILKITLNREYILKYKKFLSPSSTKYTHTSIRATFNPRNDFNVITSYEVITPWSKQSIINPQTIALCSDGVIKLPCRAKRDRESRVWRETNVNGTLTVHSRSVTEWGEICPEGKLKSDREQFGLELENLAGQRHVERFITWHITGMKWWYVVGLYLCVYNIWSFVNGNMGNRNKNCNGYWRSCRMGLFIWKSVGEFWRWIHW